ncbi:peroxiredoxin family protein [Haloferula sp. A504]|uniref:peroxiredoxin family protein n=1 Tax=Haloferula sp. A504 TaxID=3373601 RepID=UPI0031C7F31F|nr:peroxiredoxin family protein [Verrucomicrobiaceae bacterium E54]
MRLIAALLLMLPTAMAGTPSQAEAVRTAFEKSAEAFQIRMKLAQTDAEREKLLKDRPDPLLAARRMWSVIGGSLDQEWTLEPAGWFLRVVGPLTEEGPEGQALPAMRDEAAKIREAVARHHVASKSLPSVCLGLVACGGMDELELLRRIAARNPDKEVAGVAALGVAMLAKAAADDPRIMRERLSMLRKAIIDAADVTIDGVSVAEMAEEELYIIMNLSKGATAPELDGVDSGGRPVKLSQHAGKVRLLIFWESTGAETDGLLEWVATLRRDERFEGKDFEVIGVHTGPNAGLRKLQSSGQVDWPNFSDPDGKLAKAYRVGMRPTAYVLGPDRKIHYIGATGTFAELTAAAILSDQ